MACKAVGRDLNYPRANTNPQYLLPTVLRLGKIQRGTDSPSRRGGQPRLTEPDSQNTCSRRTTPPPSRARARIYRKRELTSRLRGRILITESLKDASLLRGQLHCNFDELEVDILPNQILKSTVLRVLNTDGIDTSLRTDLREIASWLAPVSTVTLHASLFHTVKYHRNNRLYGFLIRVCQMIHEELLPKETMGRFQFRAFLDNEERMGALFEEFVRNFYIYEQTQFTVLRDRIRWVADSDLPNDLAYLPFMHTDISLRSSKRAMIIDCKYYLKTLQTWHGTSSIHSAHLYQLFSYMVNLRPRLPAHLPIEGVLLYPRLDQSLNLRLILHSYRVRVYTIDLAQDWQKIRRDLLHLLQDDDDVAEPAT